MITSIPGAAGSPGGEPSDAISRSHRAWLSEVERAIAAEAETAALRAEVERLRRHVEQLEHEIMLELGRDPDEDPWG